MGRRRITSIPPRTCITLAREGKLISVARNWNAASSTTLAGKRGKMRPQISRKPFEQKLSHLEEQLHDLAQFAAEGFNVSKLEKETKEQIERLLQLLGGTL